MEGGLQDIQSKATRRNPPTIFNLDAGSYMYKEWEQVAPHVPTVGDMHSAWV